MNIQRLLAILSLCAICIAIVGQSSDQTLEAQNDPESDCLTTIQSALQVVGSACAEVGRNEACYGHAAIDTTLVDEGAGQFEASGDLSDLSNLVEITTSPINLEDGTWGVSLLEVQAELTDASEDAVTLVLFGDSSLRPNADSDVEMTNSFLLRTDSDETCEHAPDGLLVRSPEGQRARLTINGVELVMSSGVFITAEPDGDLSIQGIEGGVDVSADGQTQFITTATETTIPLDQNLDPTGPPSPPVTLVSDDIFPFDLFGDIFPEVGLASQNLFSSTGFVPPIFVTSANPWTESGISVTAGQQVWIFAWGSMNTCFGGVADFCYFNGPEGKSETSCTLEGCLVDGAPFGRLVVRFGDGTITDIGQGGLFSVPASGEMSFGINDAGWDDNAGGFIVRVLSIP